MTQNVRVYNESVYASQLKRGDLMIYPDPSSEGDDALVVQVEKVAVDKVGDNTAVHVTYEVHGSGSVDVFTEAFGALKLLNLVRVVPD